MTSQKETMETDNDDRAFACGVCEGFYGKPWSANQRRELFVRMRRFGMNTYLYAPKDDAKHRLKWRDLYNQYEIKELEGLIKCAAEFEIDFVYAISPGLDIEYSKKSDVDILKTKILQVQNMGCRSWALLFDDIDTDLSAPDELAFESVAHAQCSIANVVLNRVTNPRTFLFCPTEYCSTRAVPDVLSSEYLQTLGQQLPPLVDILWTGPRVVPRRITVEGVQEVRKVLRRPPMIWENLHANDYDQTRLYLGPYMGRPAELRQHTRGVLTNPNCEFEMNFIAIHTLAQWSNDVITNFPVCQTAAKSALQSDVTDVEMELPPEGAIDNDHVTYEPVQALRRAASDWLTELYKPANQDTNGHKSADTIVTDVTAKGDLAVADAAEDKKSPPRGLLKPDVIADDDKSESDVDMEVPAGGAAAAVTSDFPSEDSADSGPAARASSRQEVRALVEERLTTEEIVTLCDMFYSPWEHGPRAQHLLRRAHWLLSNVSRIDLAEEPDGKMSDDVKEWYENAVSFYECYKDTAILADKVLNITNREILYELYPYVTDLRSVISMVNAYIKWHGMRRPPKEPFKGGEQEPWVYRGGLHAEFRRMLPFEGENDMFPAPRPEPRQLQVFVIRPYTVADKLDVYAVCKRTCGDGNDGSDIYPDHSELMADECIGGMLHLCEASCYVLEDDAGICGYVAATADVKEYQTRLSEVWLPQMREKYARPKNTKNLTAAEEAIMSFYNGVSPIPDSLYGRYPSYVQLAVMSRRLSDPATARKLLDAVLRVLKGQGSGGVHTVINSTNTNLLAFHIKILGFSDVTDNNAPDDLIVLGHAL